MENYIHDTTRLHPIPGSLLDKDREGHLNGSKPFGVTFKQHTVVEITKALLVDPNFSRKENYWKSVVQDAIKITNEIIKQLNMESR